MLISLIEVHFMYDQETLLLEQIFTTNETEFLVEDNWSIVLNKGK